MILSNVIEPKFKRKDLDEMEYSTLKDLAETVFNLSISSLSSVVVGTHIINEKLFNDIDVNNLDKDVYDFWKQLSKPQIKKLTDNGKMILSFLQQAEEYFEIGLKCKEIADEIGVNSRGISGSMRKLLEYGYVEKKNTLKEPYESILGVSKLDRTSPKMWEMVWNNNIVSLFQLI